MAIAPTENPLVEGLERLPVPATTLVIFGASGDLARRKLLPALYNLAHEQHVMERSNRPWQHHHALVDRSCRHR